MNTISISDRIFATVNLYGRTIFNAAIEGVCSIEDVVRYVSRSLRGMASGIVTLVVRNGSQGWSVRRSLRLSSASMLPEGTQLSLAI